MVDVSIKFCVNFFFPFADIKTEVGKEAATFFELTPFYLSSVNWFVV